jgi:hypothetical protein
MSKIIRAYQLEVNDIFKRQGVELMVVLVADGKIYYTHSSSTGKTPTWSMFIGANSQEYIELVGKRRFTKRNPGKSVEVASFTLDGKYVGRYASIKEASIRLDISERYIKYYLKGLIKDKEKYGYRFEKITSGD